MSDTRKLHRSNVTIKPLNISIYTENGQPLNASEIWSYETEYQQRTGWAALEYFAQSNKAYVGQKVAYINKITDETSGEVTYSVEHYSIEYDGTLKELGKIPVGDGKTIAVDGDGTIGLKGVTVAGDGSITLKDKNNTVLEFTKTVNGETKAVTYQPVITSDGLSWVPVSETTVEGLSASIGELSQTVSGIQTAIGDDNTDASIKGRLKIAEGDIDDLETAIGDDTTATSIKGRIKATETAIGDDNTSGSVKGRIKLVENAIGDDSIAASVKGRIKTAEGDIDNLETAIGDDTTATSIKGRIKTAETDIDNIETAIGDDTTATSIKGRIKTAEGEIDALQTAVGSNTGEKSGLFLALANEIQRATTAESGLSDRINAIDDTFVNNTELSNTLTNYATKEYVGEEIGKITHPVIGVADNDKVLTLGSDKKISSTISLSYNTEKKAIELKGKDGVSLGSVDAKPFIADGMLHDVDYDTTKNELIFTWNIKDEEKSTEENTVYKTDIVPLSGLIDIYTEGNGITIDGKEISIKRASDSENFLTVDENGIKISGITTAISEAKSGAEATAAGDATTKANKALEDAKKYAEEKASAAQSAAEATAAGDATLKANAAESAAKKYAEEKASAAQSAAEATAANLYATKTAVGSIPIDSEGNPVASSIVDYVNKKSTEAKSSAEATASDLYATKAYVGTIPTDDQGNAKAANVIAYIEKRATEVLSQATGGSSESAASVKGQLDEFKNLINPVVEGHTTSIGNINTDITTIKNKLSTIDESADVNVIEGIKLKTGSATHIELEPGTDKVVTIDMTPYYTKQEATDSHNAINQTISGIDERVTANTGEITKLKTSSSNHDTNIGIIQRDITTIKSRLNTLDGLESATDAVTGSVNELSTRISELEEAEQSLIGHAEQHHKDIYGFKTTDESGKETNHPGLISKVAELYSTTSTQNGRLDALEATDTNANNRLLAIEGKVGRVGHGTSGDDDYVEPITGTLETAISGLDRRVGANETAIGTDTTAGSIKGRITAAETAIGTDTTAGSIKGRITAAETAIGDDNTTGTIKNRLKVAETDIDTLEAQVTTWAGSTATRKETDGEGNETTVTYYPDKSKSIRTIASEEVTKIVAGADEKYDTLKEIADWISNDITGTTSLTTQVTKNAEDIGKIDTRVKTAEETIKEHGTTLTKLEGNANTAGSILNLISNNNTTYVDANFVKKTDLVTASSSVLGLVKGSSAENKISIASDGTMEVNLINVNKLTQTNGDTLILCGGDASVSTQSN